MVNLRYVSSNGIEFDLHDFSKAKLQKADFHNVEWEPETVKRQYGTTVNRWTKSAQVFDVTFRFKGDASQRKQQIDNLIFETENDIAKNTPGRIYWNEQYIEVYFDSHDCQPVDAGMTWTELKGKFYAPFPFWIEEQSFHIDPTLPDPSWIPRDAKGYPMERNISYAYTYSYPYGANSGVFFVDTPLGADFRTVVYGPVTDVKMIINGNNYEIDYPLRMGQKMVIDSRDTLPLDKKCYVINENDTEINVFDYRDPTSQLFKRLPGGNIVVYVSQPYTLDITLFLERSAPI